MPKKSQPVAPEVFEQIKQETRQLLDAAVAQPDKQLWLFEEFAQANEQLARKNPKTKEGLTLAQEIFAKLVAAGHSQTEAYLAAYPACKTTNLNTVYSKASHLAKLGKVQARIETIKQKIADTALMPLTEFYQRLTAEARNGGKDSFEALIKIGCIYGVFKPEKETNVSVGAPLIVQTVDYANALPPSTEQAVGVADKREGQQ